MSFDIQGVGSSQSAASLRAFNGGASSTAATSGTEAEDGAVEVRTMPVAPPPEVMDAISTASDAYDQLQSSGLQVQFGTDPNSGRLSIQLQDLSGTTLSSLTPSHVLAIAAGETP
jgi:beta-lactamase class A